MNVLLISTDKDVWALGLRSISAVLRAAGHSTRLVFLGSGDVSHMLSAHKELAALAQSAELIGVSCLAQGSDKAREVIKYLHRQKKLIVWGGVHASLNPEECADWADIVCRGEGEAMMLELLERLEQARDWRRIENIAYKEDGSVKMNLVRSPISDLDSLPLPDFRFDDEYHLTPKGFIKVSTLPKLKDSGRIIFNGSRGCAFHCTYCCNAKLKELYPRSERYVRRMSIPRLIEHAQALRRIFPDGSHFYFIDEDFGARPLEELAQLAEEYPRQVSLPFACLSHPAQISPQKMDMLTQAGMYQIHMGIESGSEHTRRTIFDRQVSNTVIRRAAEVISRYPWISPFYFIIFGNPYEQAEDLAATARLVASLPPGFFLQAYNLVFFPGSKLFDRAVSDGLITGRGDSGYELDYLSGLKYEGHRWKRNNLYLNGLLSLMDGACTRSFLGFLPRSLFDILLQPEVIRFHEEHPAVIRSLIAMKVFYILARRGTMRLLRKIVVNPLVFNRLLHRQPTLR
jgi:radical SAM superfamily enzyme YgiQ (UPF0313 family)